MNTLIELVLRLAGLVEAEGRAARRNAVRIAIAVCIWVLATILVAVALLGLATSIFPPRTASKASRCIDCDSRRPCRAAIRPGSEAFAVGSPPSAASSAHISCTSTSPTRASSFI